MLLAGANPEHLQRFGAKQLQPDSSLSAECAWTMGTRQGWRPEERSLSFLTYHRYSLLYPDGLPTIY